MIKPINPTPLNMASDFEYHCDNCGDYGHLHFNSYVSVPDKSGDGTYEIYDQFCPKCDCNLKNKLVMHLDNEPFSLIKYGHKIIEVRLNDIKRQSIELGDVIRFINKKTGQNLEVRVVNLLRHPDFNSLFDSCDIHDFGSNNKVLSLEKMRSYYLEEDEKKYGVLGIKIELLK